jgi:outer membrane protein OmpA-like peptidoglycan-associated protein
MAFIIELLAMYGGFILFVATPVWFARIYGLRKTASYLMSFAVLMIIILPFAFAKPKEQPGFAEEWVSSGFLVFFDYNSDRFGEKGQAILEHVAAVAVNAAKTGALTSVEIGGATDTAEAAESSSDLAWQRAVSIGKALTALGVPREFVFARSLGAGHLLVFTPENVREPRNRFVTITIRAYGRVINAVEPGSTVALTGPAFGQTPPPPPAPPVPPPPALRRFLVLFDWNSSHVSDEGLSIIQLAAEAVKMIGSSRVLIGGFTDTSMSEDQSKELSQHMAEAVAAQLTEYGIPREALTVEGLGWGMQFQLVKTGPGVREPQNRRVEIVIQ